MGLDELLDEARMADPANRIDLRDPIAAHGARAIAELQTWLSDPRLGAFAVRTLERIGTEVDNRQSVLQALATVDRLGASEAVAADAREAASRLRGEAGSQPGAGGRRLAAPKSDWPGSRSVSSLELSFHDDMLAIFRLAGEATRHVRPDGSVQRGYWASYFLRGVRNHGGADYAHQLLRQEGTTEGFQRLRDEERLDLTMEALVLRAEYSTLFSPTERQIAASRLAAAGYQPAR